MKRYLLPVLATAVLALPSMASGQDDKALKDFKALECNKCHSIERCQVEATLKAEKMRGPDLSAVGSEHDSAWIRSWVLKEIDLDGKKHKGKWEGSPKQLEAIASWLATLKKP